MSSDVPDGIYHVSVEKAILIFSKTTNRPMLSWTLKILGPQNTGQLLFKNCLIVRENLKWLKMDLFRCGLTDVKPSTLEANLYRLLDLRLEVKVQTNGENRNIYIIKKC